MEYAAPVETRALPLLRVFRVLRIIRLVPRARGIRLVLATLLWSLPAMLNVAAVLFLVMYIFVSMFLSCEVQRSS